MNRFTAPLLAVGLLATLSACGSERPASGTTPANVDVDVRAIDGLAWNKGSYTATATDGSVTVYGANDSGLAHNLYVLDASGNEVGKHLDLPGRGSDGTLTVELAPGEYRIVCTIPGHSSMDSTLTVV